MTSYRSVSVTEPTFDQQEHLLRRMLTPELLLAATVLRWPEGRGPRPREVVCLEQRILARTDRTGAWK